MNLRQLIEHASNAAERRFDPDDVMMPQFVAEKPDGSITIVACAVTGLDLDRFRHVLVPLRLAAEGHCRWVFFSEAWAAVYEPGGSRAKLADRPDRHEVITFDAYEVAANRRLRASRQIIRTEAGARLLPLVFVRDRVVDVASEGAPGSRQ